MKFLIDECLSPELAKIAKREGYGETSHIVWMKCRSALNCKNAAVWLSLGI